MSTAPLVSTTPLLSAEALEVAFPGRRGAATARAVDGVDLDIRPGEIVALVGESGCGKTTLARSLLGLVPRTAGRVTFGGSPLDYSGRALKAYRKRVQLVLQDPSGSLNPRHTVYDAVAEGLRIHGYAGDERAAVSEALSRAGAAAAGAVLPALPARAVGRSAPARRDRRGAGPGAGADRGRRTGGLAGRLGTGRDPGPPAAPPGRTGGSRRWSSPMTSGSPGTSRTGWRSCTSAGSSRRARSSSCSRPLSTRTPGPCCRSSPRRRANGRPTGEPPDPSKVPSGCRFHVRCQVLASGEAERAGVAEACRTVDLPVLNGGAETQVACHWAAACGEEGRPGSTGVAT
ncbi:hypothetical protein SMICM304S_02339 [Streptomyces microflavus]